jgi:hypothetical protein
MEIIGVCSVMFCGKSQGAPKRTTAHERLGDVEPGLILTAKILF